MLPGHRRQVSLKSPRKLQILIALVHSANKWLAAHAAFLRFRHVSQPHLIKSDVPHYRNKFTSAHANLALSLQSVINYWQNMLSHATEVAKIKCITKKRACTALLWCSWISWRSTTILQACALYICPLGNSKGFKFLFISKKGKGEKNPAWKRNSPGSHGFCHFQSGREWARATFRAPSFPLWGKVGVWQPWLPFSFFPGCSED